MTEKEQHLLKEIKDYKTTLEKEKDKYNSEHDTQGLALYIAE